MFQLFLFAILSLCNDNQSESEIQSYFNSPTLFATDPIVVEYEKPDSEERKPIRVYFDYDQLSGSDPNRCTKVGQKIKWGTNSEVTCQQADIITTEKKEIIKQTLTGIAAYLKQLLKVKPVKSIQLAENNNYIFTNRKIENYDIYFSVLGRPFDEGGAAAAAVGFPNRNPDYRPKTAFIALNLRQITKVSTINDQPRDLFEIILHEVFHGLGLMPSVAEYWVEDGKTLQSKGQNPYYSCTFPYTTRSFTFITNKAIKEFIKDRYGDDDFGKQKDGTTCPSGIELEDDGSSGTAYSHPESRCWPLELMTGFHATGKRHSISNLTLNLLRATGYYDVDFSLAEPMTFGESITNFGERINKFLVSVPQTQWPDQYQCDAEKAGSKTSTRFRACYPDLKSIGMCNRRPYLTTEVDITKDIDFHDPKRTGYVGPEWTRDYVSTPEFYLSCTQNSTNNWETSYGGTPGENAICHTTSLTKNEPNYEMLVGNCHTIKCNDDHTSYTVLLQDGTTGECTEQGKELTFPESTFKYGKLICQDPKWACHLLSLNFDPTPYPEPEPGPDTKPDTEPAPGPDPDTPTSGDEDGKTDSSGNTNSNKTGIIVGVVIAVVVVAAAVVVGILIWRGKIQLPFKKEASSDAENIASTLGLTF